MKVRTSSWEGSVFVCTWADGVITRWDSADLADDVREEALKHGVSQKTMDAHSGIHKATGSVAKCREASQAVWDQIAGGAWNVGRGPRKFPYLADCLVAIGGMAESEAIAFVHSLNADEQAELAGQSEVVKWKLEQDLIAAKAKAKDTKGGLAAFLKGRVA